MPTMRDNATVTVVETVDGKVRRRRTSSTNTRRATTTHELVVDPLVMAAARLTMRPGQRLVIVSATEVRLVNR